MKSTNSWKLKFGGHTKEELLILLSKNKTCLNAYATMLFMDEKFLTSSTEKEARLVELNLSDMGFKSGAKYSEVVEASKVMGLQMCPLEIAPYFRIHFKNQNEGPFLTLASFKMRDCEEYPNGFSLKRYDNNLWLRGYCSTSDWVRGNESKFVFAERLA